MQIKMRNKTTVATGTAVAMTVRVFLCPEEVPLLVDGEEGDSISDDGGSGGVAFESKTIVELKKR